MSFDSMVATQPAVRVYRSSSPNLTNSGGLAAQPEPTLVTTIRGRLIMAGASQQAYWLTLGIVANYSLDTKYEGIQNGDIVKYTDPRMGERVFTVMGTRGQYMGQGSIASYLKYPCQESVK